MLLQWSIFTFGQWLIVITRSLCDFLCVITGICIKMSLFITIFKLYCWWERRHSLLIPQKAQCMCHFHIHSPDLVNNFFDFYMASCLYRITRCSMDYYLHIKVEIILLMSLLSFSEEPSFLYSGEILTKHKFLTHIASIKGS